MSDGQAWARSLAEGDRAEIISGVSPPPGSPERIADGLMEIARRLETLAAKLDALRADVLRPKKKGP